LHTEGLFSSKVLILKPLSATDLAVKIPFTYTEATPLGDMDWLRFLGLCACLARLHGWWQR